MIKKRIIELIDYKGLPKEQFYTKIGMTSASFRGKARETPINSNAIENILSIFPDLNPKWLISGEGEMIISNKMKLSSDDSVSYLHNDLRADNNQSIPLYNLEASAGIVTLFKDSANYDPVDYISIPNLPKSDGAIYVTGDSMYPLLKSGDIVIYKQLDACIDNIFWGEMYLISVELSGDITTFVKWIQKSELGEEYIALVSQNQHHQSKDIHISKIKALAMVKASIRINSMN